MTTLNDELTEAESEALAQTYDQPRPRSTAARRRVLHRLLEPIDEVTGHWHQADAARVRNCVLGRVHTKQQPYWCWDKPTWIDVAKQAALSGDRGSRGPVVAVAHLLGLHRTLHHHVQVQELRRPGYARTGVRPCNLGDAMAQMTWDELRQLPSAVDLETAGRALGIGRSKIYEMAKTGELQQTIRVLKFGRAYRVVTADLYRVLGVSTGDGPMMSAVSAPGPDAPRDAAAPGQEGGAEHARAGAPPDGAGGRNRARRATLRPATRPENAAAS